MEDKIKLKGSLESQIQTILEIKKRGNFSD